MIKKYSSQLTQRVHVYKVKIIHEKNLRRRKVHEKNRMRSEGGLTTKDSMDWTEQQGNAQKKCSLYNPSFKPHSPWSFRLHTQHTIFCSLEIFHVFFVDDEESEKVIGKKVVSSSVVVVMMMIKYRKGVRENRALLINKIVFLRLFLGFKFRYFFYR